MDANRALARLAERQHGLVTRAQALGKGLSKREIESRLDTGLWQTLHRGVYRLAGSPTTWEQAVMGVCLAAGAVASHRTAAAVWALPLLAGDIEVPIAQSRRTRLRGVVVHRATQLEGVDCVHHKRLPVTSVPRTLIDLAGVLPEARLEVVLDHALAHRQVPLGYLRSRLDALGTRGRDGAGTLAALIEVRLGGSRRPRSAPERQLERALAASGLPPATREHPVRLPDGREVRIDFAFPGAMLAVEVDSYVHHSSLSDWSRDRERNSELIALGWRILPVTPRAIDESPGAVLGQIARALRPKVEQPAGQAAVERGPRLA